MSQTPQHPGEADAPLELLRVALDQVATVIAALEHEDLRLPTPCRSWDVDSLVDHLVQDLEKFTAAARRERPQEGSASPSGEGDRVRAFRDGADGLLDTWRRSGDLDRTVHLPFGDVPATFVVNQQIAEFAVHGSAPVRATARSADLDPRVAEVALAWARTALRPEFRGHENSGMAFGPEVAVPPDAGAYERLAGFFGRDPARAGRPPG